jgi:hypothetical protein
MIELTCGLDFIFPFGRFYEQTQRVHPFFKSDWALHLSLETS